MLGFIKKVWHKITAKVHDVRHGNCERQPIGRYDRRGAIYGSDHGNIEIVRAIDQTADKLHSLNETIFHEIHFTMHVLKPGHLHEGFDEDGSTCCSFTRHQSSTCSVAPDQQSTTIVAPTPTVDDSLDDSDVYVLASEYHPK